MDNIDFISLKVKNKIKQDVKKIEKLLEMQQSMREHRNCPLYQDVIDTQIFGLSKEIELSIEIGALTVEEGKKILEELENKSTEVYTTSERKVN